MTGMALGWTAATSRWGSVVRKANRSHVTCRAQASVRAYTAEASPIELRRPSFQGAADERCVRLRLLNPGQTPDGRRMSPSAVVTSPCTVLRCPVTTFRRQPPIKATCTIEADEFIVIDSWLPYDCTRQRTPVYRSYRVWRLGMAGSTLSFVADPRLVARVKEIARSDGVTQSQAAARASALGALLPPGARKTFRYVLEEGGEEAQKQLAAAIAKAVARVGNAMLERQLLAHAEAAGLPSGDEGEDDIARLSVEAVAENRRARASDGPVLAPGSPRRPRDEA
jgi:hypothetical protein